jgi:predicted DNA-binding transcriptional regulator YafY
LKKAQLVPLCDIDRRARIVLGLFSRQESVTAAEMARSLGLSPRTVRDLVRAAGWPMAGWCWLIRRASHGATIYRRNIGSLSAK